MRNGYRYRKARHEIYDRDGGLCALCGRQGEQVHHIIFRSHCGGDCLNNLALLCADCHRKAHGVKAREIRALLQKYIDKKNAEVMSNLNQA